MNTLQLQRNKTSTIIEQINEELQGDLSRVDGEYKLELDNETGTGYIHYAELKNGITYLAYDILFHKDIKIAHESIQHNPILFTYARDTEIEHSFGNEGSKRKIGRFQTGILRGNNHVDSVFHFSKENSYQMTMMIVPTKSDEIAKEDNSILFDKIGKLFTTSDSEDNFVYLGSYNLKIAEKIKQLNAVSYDGIVRSLMKDAIVNTILAMEIQQHADDLKNKSLNIGSLTKRQMEMIKDLSEFIENYPERSYTIDSLCIQSGLSSAKLQEGFRMLKGMTVSHYIRDVRVRKAEQLIKTTDLNISEIVYSIGLTSRSYFSKVFKKKYECSPKSYQEKQRSIALAV